MPTPAENWKLVWSEEFDTPTSTPPTGTAKSNPPDASTKSGNATPTTKKTLTSKTGNSSSKPSTKPTNTVPTNTPPPASIPPKNKLSVMVKLLPASNSPMDPASGPPYGCLVSTAMKTAETPPPHCGEIDILELYGSNNDAIVEANIHYANLNHKHSMLTPPQYQLPHGTFADDFHLFEIIWNQHQIQWLPPTPVPPSPNKNAGHQEFYLLLNIAIGGEWAGRPDETTVFPQTMTIDWIRVYQAEEE